MNKRAHLGLSVVIALVAVFGLGVVLGGSSGSSDTDVAGEATAPAAETFDRLDVAAEIRRLTTAKPDDLTDAEYGIALGASIACSGLFGYSDEDASAMARNLSGYARSNGEDFAIAVWDELWSESTCSAGRQIKQVAEGIYAQSR